LECTRQWRKERRILKLLRDIVETYPELGMKIQMEIGVGLQVLKEWKHLETPFLPAYFSISLACVSKAEAPRLLI
jgi:hypothetical protein